MLIKIIKKILKGVAALFLSILLLAAVLIGYFVIVYHRPLTLPSPTGPYQVGRAEYDWVDQNRTDTLSPQPTRPRELVVWVWYPAGLSAGDSTAPYLPPDWAKAYDQDQEIGRYLERNLSTIRTHSYADVSLTNAEDTYPVIVMQPGMGRVPTDYTVYAENLASHGYVVFGINPTYSADITVFPDGRLILRSTRGTIPDSATMAAANQDANRIEKVWADDAVFVMDQLESLNVDPSSRFYGRLDLTRIGLFGHSLGGATAFGVCETDPRCRAGADLDGTLWSAERQGILQRPFLFMAEDNCGNDCTAMHQAYADSKSAAYYLSIQGTRHFNYSDLPLRLPPPTQVLFRTLGAIGSIDSQRGLEISNTYLVAFFDQELKGVNSKLPNDFSSAYPEVNLEKH